MLSLNLYSVILGLVGLTLAMDLVGSAINTKFVIFIYYRENAVLAILLRKRRLCPNTLDWSEH